MAQREIWDLWYPNAASQGLQFARGLLDATEQLLVHAAPDSLRVEIRSESGERLAFADQLPRTAERPITLLRRRGKQVVWRDLWPAGEQIGLPIILPGGEVGILKGWWNAEDGSEWRWQVEFYNCRGR